MCSRIERLNHPQLCDSRRCQSHPEAEPFPELAKHKSHCNRTEKSHNRSVFPLFRYFEWKKAVNQESGGVSREKLNPPRPFVCGTLTSSLRAKCLLRSARSCSLPNALNRSAAIFRRASSSVRTEAASGVNCSRSRANRRSSSSVLFRYSSASS